MTDAEARKKRRDDATCEALVQVLWKIRAHVHGDTPIRSMVEPPKEAA